MDSAPWDGLPSEDTLFVLVTGTNNGVGVGIGQRLVDEFLATRSLSSHLVLVATTRSPEKSRATVAALRRHVTKRATKHRALAARVGPGYEPRHATRRIHVLGLELDLCDFPSVLRAADRLVNGTLGVDGHDDDDHFAPLVNVKMPRLDVVIFNAGMGGWLGVHYVQGTIQVFQDCIKGTTYPDFKINDVGRTVDPLESVSGRQMTVPDKARPRLGKVFCANVFGHYLLAHALLPLLTRPAGSHIPPGRIIWQGSVWMKDTDFSPDDMQGVRVEKAYESSKRLMDLLVLGYSLPTARPYVSSFLDGPASASETSTRPKMYVCHPGVAVTSLMQDDLFSTCVMIIIFTLARWLGSPWHVVTSYKAAVSAVWLALQHQGSLDAAHAERSKWGSCADFWGNEFVKKGEITGWGWDGVAGSPETLESGAELGRASKAVGRMPGTSDPTKESIEEVQVLSGRVWKDMEALRVEWEARTKEAAGSCP